MFIILKSILTQFNIGGENMKKFIILYYADMSAMEQMNKSTPEEMKKGMEAWNNWAKGCGKLLLDLGSPLGNGMVLTQKGSSKSDSQVGGYSILQAGSMDDAKKLLSNHPHLGWDGGCRIEVHESLPMPG